MSVNIFYISLYFFVLLINYFGLSVLYRIV